MLRPILSVVSLLAVSACATTTTQLAPVAPERIEHEEQRQRELVLAELQKAQARLDLLGQPLLAAALPLCPEDAGPRHGLRFAALTAYDGPWRRAASTALGLSDTATITLVTGRTSSCRGR